MKFMKSWGIPVMQEELQPAPGCRVLGEEGQPQPLWAHSHVISSVERPEQISARSWRCLIVSCTLIYWTAAVFSTVFLIPRSARSAVLISPTISTNIKALKLFK